MVTRIVSLTNAGDGWLSFGVPHDEDPTLKRRLTEREQILRLYVVGQTNISGNISWRRSGYHDDSDIMGMSWGLAGRPTPLVVSSYGNSSNVLTTVRSASNAGNNPFLNATELIDVELVAGTLHSTQKVGAIRTFEFQPRRVGILPYLMQGRENFGDWHVSSDVSSSWLHTERGVYLRWGGPPPSGSLTGSMVVTLSSSLLLDQSGFSSLIMNDPSFDPTVDESSTFNDKDATRYRKTYSYFRQEARNVGVVKMGSNPSKS
jgi:hypothetical protein